MVATPERARSPSSIREPLQNINSLPFRWRDNSPLAHQRGVTKREWISPSKPQWIERDTCTYTGIGGSVAGTTPLHHSSYFIFQDQDIRRRFHSGRPHWQYQISILIGNIKVQFLLATIKTQFSLATSKPNSHWQHQSPIFISTTLSKRKEPKIINTWQRKNIMLP